MSHQASPDDNFRDTPSGSLSRRAAREVTTTSATGSSASQIAKAQTARSSPGRYAKLLNGRRHRKALWAILVLGALICGFTLDHYFWGFAAIFALVVPFDRVKLTYNLSPDARSTFDRFVESFQQAARSQCVYMIEREGRVANSYQRKVNDGMSVLIRTERASAVTRPRDLAVNLPVPTLRARSRSLYFLPDKIVLRDAGGYAELSYQDVSVSSSTSPGSEHRIVPKDARQIGTTWTYVNKDGGPDHRFKNNPTVPILLYDEIALFSKVGGFKSEWQFSRTGSVGDWVSNLHVRGAAQAL